MSILSRAQNIYNETVAEAEAKAARIIEEAEAEALARVKELEDSIAKKEEDLRNLSTFEAEYRGRLKSELLDMLNKIEPNN